MKLSRIDMFAVAVVLLQVAVGLCVFRFGAAGSFPVHFDWKGHPNGWGDRNEIGWVVLAFAAATLGLHALLPVLARRSSKVAVSATGLAIAQLLLLSIFLLATAQIAWLALGTVGKTGVEAPVMAFLAATMLVIGFWIGKVGPNHLVGVRTPWSLRSRLAWDKSNRLFGRIAFWAGLLGLIATPLTPEPLGVHIMSAVLLGASVLSVFESWRVWRTDPDRRVV